MNRIKSNVYMLLAVIFFVAGACSGEDGASVREVPVNPDALCAITPHAIEISPVDASATPITRSATGEPEQKATCTENLGVNYSVEATLEAMPQEAQTRETGNLAEGAQYRIVVFDGAGEIVGNAVYIQGSTIVVEGETIKLKPGTYRLFAYTFNDISHVRGLDADNKNVTVNSGEDFMTYTEATYTVASTNCSSGKQLNISFTRQCTHLAVAVVADGYTSNIISAASLTVGNIFGSSSKWNGTTQSDASTLASAAGTASLIKTTTNNTWVYCGPALGKPALFIPPCSNQTISVSGLSVTVDGVTKTPADFNFFNPVTLAKGGLYKLTITASKYYVLTRTSPVTIGGVKWARTNLQQTGAGDDASVSFTANPWDPGSHWSWGIRDATRYGEDYNLSGFTYWNNYTSSGTNQNPCCALGSGWRLPTNDELSSLIDNPAPSGTNVKINGTLNTIGKDGWAPDAKGVVCKSGNLLVFLPAAGSRQYTNGTLFGPGTYGYYWTTTPSDLLYAYHLYLKLDYIYGGTLSSTRASRQTGHSLRCVQDN